MGLLFCELFRGAFENDFTSVKTGFGADLDDVVGVFNDIGLVFDDEEGVADVDEAMEDGEEFFDVDEVETRGGFVENEKSVDASGGGGKELAEFEALGFAAGEGVEGLAETEVAEPCFDERLEGLTGFGEEAGFSVCEAFNLFQESDGFRGGEPKEIDDGFSVVFVGLGGAGEAGAVALGASEVEVGKELHLDLFEAVAGAALTAAWAGVERKVAGGEFVGFCGRSLGKELAEVFKSAEEDGRGGPGSA